MNSKLRIRITPDGGEIIISESQIPMLRELLPDYFARLKENGIRIITPDLNPEIALTLCG